MDLTDSLFAELQSLRANVVPNSIEGNGEEKATDRKAYRKAYYQAHKEEFAARAKAYQKAHPERVKESRTRYNHAHREEINEKQRNFRKDHPETVAQWTQNRYDKDPLWTRKRYVEVVSSPAGKEKQRKSNQISQWRGVVAYIRNNPNKTIDELAQELATVKTVHEKTFTQGEKYLNASGTLEARKRNTLPSSQTVYRPRIKNTVLTPEQIDELTDFALKAGLSTDMELIHTEVSYDGDMKKLVDDRENKKVDIYTTQSKYLEKEGEEGIRQKIQNNNYKALKKAQKGPNGN